MKTINITIFFLPWLLLPLMLNIRVFPFVAPYEEPRWLLLVAVLFVLLMVTAYQYWRGAWLWSWRRQHAASYALFVFLLVMLIGVGHSPNPIEGLLRFTFWLAACAVFYASAWNTCQSNNQETVFVWATSLACFSFSLHYWWLYITEYGHAKYTAVGANADLMVFFSPIGHVNFTGDVLIILLPMLAYLLWSQRQPLLLIANSISIASMVLILLIGSSRGALGGLLVGLLLTWAVSAKHARGYLPTLIHWKPFTAITGILLVLLLTLHFLPIKFRNPMRVVNTVNQVFVTPSTPLRTDVAQPPLASFWWHIQPLIAKERTAIYASATAMVADAPWWGHGTGSFPFVFPAYSNHFPQFRDSLSTMRNITDNPHNIFFQIATENGIPVALLLISLLLFLWCKIACLCWQRADARIMASCMALTAALFDSLFNHVFFNPASLFVFALFAGVWWGWLTQIKHKKNTITIIRKEQKPRRIVSLMALVIGVILLLWPIRWGMSEWYLGHTLLGNNAPQTVARYYRLAFEADPYNFRAVSGMAAQAFAHQNYNQSVQLLERLVKIYPYNAAALNNLAALYAAAGHKKHAIVLLQHALQVQPDFTMAQKKLKELL